MTRPEQPTPTDQARTHLATIHNGWRHVLDPIRVDRGGTTQGGTRPATEDDLDLPPDARLDTPVMLAFWVHAATHQWPAILDTATQVPVPTTDPHHTGWTIHVTTGTIDCTNVHAMCDLLDREADRLTDWVDDATGRNFGATFVTELERHATAVARVAWPPKGDRMVIGDCPACGRRIRVKAPKWVQDQVPQPTTDPATYPAWTVLPGATWRPVRDRPVACRCGKEDTIEGWRERLAGPVLHLTAEQLVEDIHAQLGLRYQPLTVRTWQRRGLCSVVGYNAQGRALYDRTQVLAALMARERLALDERSA